MKDKEKILLLLSIIILLIFLYIIDLYNIIRYVKIRYFCSKEYIHKYSKIKKCTNDKVIISLTTVPSRIKNIKSMLYSLLDQTVKVDKIYLNIPDECKNEKYDVPEEYNEICNIFNVGRDYGPGTKYIPTLLREKNCGVKIILVDDDYIYGKDLIQKLLETSEKNPNKCVYIGKDFKNAQAILIKPDFVQKINHNYCDNEWLKDNLNVDKIHIPYKKNLKYI